MFFIHMGGRTNIFYKQRDKCFFFPNLVRGGRGHQFSLEFKIVQVILGGRGQDNYEIFAQFVTFFVWNASITYIMIGARGTRSPPATPSEDNSS